MHEKEMLQNFEATVAGTQQIGRTETENFAANSGEIMWVGGYWTSGKHLKHYDSFCINGITIPVRSFCYIMIEKSERLIAYILDLYEDKKSQKKMKVRWLHKSKEIKSPIPPPQPLENELFMTRYTQVLRLESCDGVVYVLTPNHFEVSMPILTMSGEHIYVCGRHFGNEGFKPYDLSTVKGYWNQRIFSSGLIPPYLSDIARANTDCHEDEQGGLADFHEDEQAGSVHVIKSGTKAPRSARRRAAGKYDLLNEEGEWAPQQGSSHLSYDAADTVTSSAVNLLKVFHDTNSRGASTVFSHNDFGKVGNTVEILCNDSGMRGCWFRCTVLETNTSMKVRYDDVLEVDSDKKLEEWILVNNIARADKLGFRIPGRQMMRPLPPEVEMASSPEQGSAVDVWGGEGWWEGILVGRNASGQVKVAFPAEKYTAWVDVSKIRISREWVDGRWLVVQPDAKIINKISGLHNTRLVSSHKNDRILASESALGLEAAAQSPHSGAEGREGMLPDQGVNRLVAASYPASKVLALPIGSPTTEALENASVSANLNSATLQTPTQVPIFLECKEGMKLPNLYKKYSGNIVEPAAIHHTEDLDSKCISAILVNSCKNISEDNDSSQLANLQWQDVNRDKKNNAYMIDMTSEGLSLLSRKRHRDVDSTLYIRPSKSGLFPSRDPSVSQAQEKEDMSVGVFTFDKLTEIGNVDTKRPPYGFEQVNPSTGTPVGGPLFNPVSVQNLVLSR